jgi:hypothetical protein
MRMMTALLPLAAFLATPALADTAQRAGHYYLDGRFQWYLVYGALDLFAEGRWQEKDGAVLLTAEKTKDVPEPGFQTLMLTIKDSALVPPDGRGAYIRPSDEKD